MVALPPLAVVTLLVDLIRNAVMVLVVVRMDGVAMAQLTVATVASLIVRQRQSVGSMPLSLARRAPLMCVARNSAFAVPRQTSAPGNVNPIANSLSLAQVAATRRRGLSATGNLGIWITPAVP